MFNEKFILFDLKRLKTKGKTRKLWSFHFLRRLIEKYYPGLHQWAPSYSLATKAGTKKAADYSVLVHCLSLITWKDPGIRICLSLNISNILLGLEWNNIFSQFMIQFYPMSLKRFLCVSLFIINLPWLNTITVCSKLNINQIVSVQPLTSSLPSIPPDSNSSVPAFSTSPSLWSLSAWPSVKLQNIDILIMDPRQRRWGLRGFEVPRVDLPTLRYPLTWLPSAQVHPRDIVLSWQWLVVLCFDTATDFCY